MFFFHLLLIFRGTNLFLEGDKEYGVSRGVDFRGIMNVVNFDCPESPQSYVHRVGRTARAGKEGLAITLVGDSDWEKWEAIQADQEKKVCCVDDKYSNQPQQRQ